MQEIDAYSQLCFVRAGHPVVMRETTDREAHARNAAARSSARRARDARARRVLRTVLPLTGVHVHVHVHVHVCMLLELQFRTHYPTGLYRI